MKSSFKALLTAAGLMVAVSASGATVTTFTANYGTAYSGGATDTVSGFNAYDFAPGAVLLQNASTASTGYVVNGYFQAYTVGHLAPGGSTVAAPNLNTTGSGAGYELTIAGNFQEQIDSISGGVASFTILNSGTATMRIGSPDYNFGSDTGFTDGTAILTGNIVGGSGTFSSSGLGVTSLIFQATSYDGDVYSPGILGGTSVFTLQAPGSGGSTAFLSDITSNSNKVMGQTVTSSDLLLAGDGNLNLTAVPVPPALWLFGSGLVGIVGLARRRSA